MFGHTNTCIWIVLTDEGGATNNNENLTEIGLSWMERIGGTPILVAVHTMKT